MTAYQMGNYYERRTAVLFRHDGYEVWQTRGSKGAADLIALKPGQICLVQVKSGTKQISGEQWNALFRLAAGLQALPIVADWKDGSGRGRSMALRRITARHVPGSHWWPCEPWHLDALEAAVEAHRQTGGPLPPLAP